MNIKIIVATHKKYRMPDDDLYLPLQVGAEGKESLGFQKDNDGQNISLRNPYFCELTGLYWAWKNLKADYIGLVHYRRYFTLKRKIPKNEDEKFKVVLNQEQIERILKEEDIILPKQRNYFIENIYDHYKHTMYIEPLDITGEIITLPLKYSTNDKKVSSIYIVFKSSTNSTPKYNTGVTIEMAGKNQTSHIGSILRIDDIKLNYE